MKTLQNTPTNPEKFFTVTKKDINNNKALLPNVLYETMEKFVNSIAVNNTEISNTAPRLYKLEILRNAFLHDKLLITSQIKKLNDLELHLSVIVKQRQKKSEVTICKAIFKYQFKNNVAKAS